MEIAIHNWMRAESIETTLNRIAGLGYDKIEIQGSPELYDTTHVLRLLKSHHLTCWGAVTLMLEDRNLLAKDIAQRKKISSICQRRYTHDPSIGRQHGVCGAGYSW